MWVFSLSLFLIVRSRHVANGLCINPFIRPTRSGILIHVARDGAVPGPRKLKLPGSIDGSRKLDRLLLAVVGLQSGKVRLFFLLRSLYFSTYYFHSELTEMIASGSVVLGLPPVEEEEEPRHYERYRRRFNDEL